jgi:7-carboxy-7-deazaguanine synthase
LIPISEVFGPVIQGEGPAAGLSTIFVRTGGCDYRCVWCDTLYAVLPENSESWLRMTSEAVFDAVDAIASKIPGGAKTWITLSGGNPAMWPLDELIVMLQTAGHRVTIETQASVVPDWAGLLDGVVLSPKPPSSGEVANFDQVEKWLWAGRHAEYRAIKVVVADDADLEFFGKIHARFASSRAKLYVQPCNPYTSAEGELDVDRLDLMARYSWLCDAVIAQGWMDVHVMPQLHVLASGGGRGK